MTPDQALAKLEGRTLDEGKMPTMTKPQFKPQFKDRDIPKRPAVNNINKSNDFIRVFAIVLIVGALIILYLWRIDAVSGQSYKNGFNDGVASISPNLTSAQKEINNKYQQLNQLQQALGVMTQQKDQLALSLKETQDSLPRVEQKLEGKIRNLTEASQKEISGLNNQLGLAQKDASDKGQQLAETQKNLNDKLQQLEKLQQDFNKSKSSAMLLQQEAIKISQELKAVTLQRDQLVKAAVKGPSKP